MSPCGPFSARGGPGGLRPRLSRCLEPRAPQPERRLRAIETLAGAGVPAGVMVAPVIPALTDHELPAILKAARERGARYAGYILLRLPHGVKDLFAEWLDNHTPARRKKVLSRIRSTRGGRLNDSRFGRRMRGEGVFAEGIRALFAVSARRLGFDPAAPVLSTAAFRRPGGVQLELFVPGTASPVRPGGECAGPE